jgi:hypothetical protein
MSNFDFNVRDNIPSVAEIEADERKEELERIAPESCKKCYLLEAYLDDNTKGYDLPKRLKGSEDIELIPCCEEFKDGVQPDKCSQRNITIPAFKLMCVLNLIVEARKQMYLSNNPFIQPRINLHIAEKELKELFKTA